MLERRERDGKTLSRAFREQVQGERIVARHDLSGTTPAGLRVRAPRLDARTTFSRAASPLAARPI
jgi:hypothetical protein